MNPIGTPNKVINTPFDEARTEKSEAWEVTLPPITGSLPYTKGTYENLPSAQKTPGLDFLILGKIPGGKRDASMPAEPLSKAFNEVVHECLKRGELNALDFLWRESGRDPNNSTIDLAVYDLDAVTANAICEYCRQHSGLMVKLTPLRVDETAIAPLVSLIALGKVTDLDLYAHTISTQSLARLVSVVGQVKHKLTLFSATFDIHSERALGESLANSPSLKELEICFCDFGVSRGMQFVQGMTKNQSIVSLKMIQTPLPPTLTSGYGVMLAKNTRLEKLIIQNQIPLPADADEIHVEAILMAAARNESLKHLNFIHDGEPTELAHPGHLIYLLQKNRTLTELQLNLCLPTHNTMSLVEALGDNTTLTDFSLNPHSMLDDDLAEAIDEMLARNRALTNDAFLQKAGWAFDPLQRHNGLSDVGSVIAQHMLQNSASLEAFADTMAVVELSMKELAQSASAFGSDGSLASIMRTTADTASTTTTTTTNATTITTTTTTTSPPGPASS